MNIALPLTDRERELGGIIDAYNQVTERLKQSHDKLVGEVRRLREQVEEKNRELARRERLAALGEMAAGVAHEIRNPLAGIQLYASLLQKDLAANEEGRTLAEKISNGVRTLDGIVSDVLDFAGQNNPQMGAVDVNEIIQHCLGYAAPACSANGTSIDTSEVASGLMLYVDQGQLQRAVLNLIFNAIDAAGEGGEVRVSTAVIEDEDICEIRISDNGPGIPEGLTNKIFNPFFTTKDSGTGLGLAIVHSIAESNDGCVRAGNAAGGGAELILTLPLYIKQDS